MGLVRRRRAWLRQLPPPDLAARSILAANCTAAKRIFGEEECCSGKLCPHLRGGCCRRFSCLSYLVFIPPRPWRTSASCPKYARPDCESSLRLQGSKSPL